MSLWGLDLRRQLVFLSSVRLPTPNGKPEALAMGVSKQIEGTMITAEKMKISIWKGRF